MDSKCEIKISSKLANDIVDMIFKNNSKISLYRKHPLKRKGTRDMVRRHIGAALKCGAFDYLYSGDNLLAYVFFMKTEFVPGLPSTFGRINCTGSKKAQDWIRSKLDELQFMFDSSTLFSLPYALKGMLPVLNRAGFNIDTIKLMGFPKECLRKFDDGNDPATVFSEHGLSLSHASQQDLLAVKDIEKREFKRNPQFGWFVASEPWLKHMYKIRQKSLKIKDANCYVLKNRNNKVKGYFGLWAHPTPEHGKLAGPELIFDKSLQGRGLSRPAYQILLKDMIEMNAVVFEGNTAQAGVLKHAKSMGRVPVDLVMRYTDGYFCQDHFLKHFAGSR